MIAWLTPDTVPSGTVTLKITVPDDVYFLGQLRGLLFDLANEDNYEQHGTATPEDTAAAWMAVAGQLFEECDCGE